MKLCSKLISPIEALFVSLLNPSIFPVSVITILTELPESRISLIFIRFRNVFSIYKLTVPNNPIKWLSFNLPVNYVLLTTGF